MALPFLLLRIGSPAAAATAGFRSLLAFWSGGGAASGAQVYDVSIYEPLYPGVTADSGTYTADSTNWTADGAVLVGATDTADAAVAFGVDVLEAADAADVLDATAGIVATAL